MPTRKQRRRMAKSKRHEYEFVYVDAEGQEVAPTEEQVEAERQAAREPSTNGAKAASAPRKAPAPRGGRAGRVPPAPTWQRAFKRASILGVVVFALFALGAKGRSNGYLTAALLAILYTALFIPFTYMIDRFAYRRWEARQPGAPPRAKKR